MPVYATVDELTTWLGDYPPVNADTLLARASLLVDDVLVGAVYPTDETGAPTDVVVAGGLRDAVCAQVAWWQSLTGDDGGRLVATPRHHQPDLKMAPAQVADDALRVLRGVGLLPVRPWVHG